MPIATYPATAAMKRLRPELESLIVTKDEHLVLVKKSTHLSAHMHDLKFGWTEPTLIFDFLEQYHRDCIYVDFSENEAYFVFDNFLERRAKSLFYPRSPLTGNVMALAYGPPLLNRARGRLPPIRAYFIDSSDHTGELQTGSQSPRPKIDVTRKLSASGVPHGIEYLHTQKVRLSLRPRSNTGYRRPMNARRPDRVRAALLFRYCYRKELRLAHMLDRVGKSIRWYPIA
eukprot:IDg9992t1